tara:strand:+ start:164 stop:454 length:291 start_codon:yes stop_codon:yes gene_type:complete
LTFLEGYLVLESSHCPYWTSNSKFDVLNSLSNKLIMERNQHYTDNSKDIVNEIKPLKHSESIEKSSYLYPNGHRITHQMRWFKGSRDRGSKSDLAA